MIVAAVIVVVAAVVERGPRPDLARRIGRPGAAVPARLIARGWATLCRIADREAVVRRTSVAAGSLVEDWAAALRAGAPAGRAFAEVCSALPAVRLLVPRAWAAARTGEDLGPALRLDAASVADPVVRRALLQAAACAAIASGSGGRLADALDRIGAGVRAEREHRELVRSQLAAPRATARLLAGLPLLALALESGAGMRPFEALRTGVGPALLVGGGALILVGLGWNARIARSAIRGP